MNAYDRRVAELRAKEKVRYAKRKNFKRHKDEMEALAKEQVEADAKLHEQELNLPED